MSNGTLGQETFGFWQKTTSHALNTMKNPSGPDFEANSNLIWKLLDKGFLGMAFLQYMNKQVDTAFQTLKSIYPPNTPELINAAKLLKATCMIDVAGDSAISEIISVFNSIFSDKGYVDLISDTTVLEQLIFACAAKLYVVMLRRGIGTPADPQLADAVLDYAYNALSEDIAKKGLRPQS